MSAESRDSSQASSQTRCLFGPPETLWESQVQLAGAGPFWYEPAPGCGHWVVGGAVDARRVLSETATFSSAFGTGYRSTPGLPLQFPYRSEDPPYRSLNLSDPPFHGRLRRPLDAWFRERLDRIRTALQARVSELVGSLERRRATWHREQALGSHGVAVEGEHGAEDGAAEHAHGAERAAEHELVAELADPLAWQALLLLLDLPEPPADLKATVERISFPPDRATYRRAEAELRELLSREPIGPDLGLEKRDRTYLSRLLLLGGWASTCALLSLALWQRVEPEPTAAADLCPVTRFGRVVVRPTVLNGVSLAVGDRVVVMLGAAHQDRPGRMGLAFGHGPHRCPGEPLARLTLDLMLAELDRLGRYRLRRPPEWWPSAFILGPRRIWIEWS